MADDMDDAYDGLAEVERRQDAEWREVEEELEENVEYSRLRRRTLADLALEAMHAGAVVVVAVGTRSFTGTIVQVGPDSMIIQDGHGNEVGLELAWLSTYRVVESPTGGAGRPKRGGEPGAFADLLVVDGDPLKDIGLLAVDGKNLRTIVRGGEVVKHS